jgi:hypothetical protein
LTLLKPAQVLDEGSIEAASTAEENPFAAGNKLALMSEFERAQFEMELRRQEERAHNERRPSPSRVARGVRQLGRKGRWLASEADEVLKAAAKLEVPASHNSFHYEWTDGTRQLQHAGQEFSRVAAEYEARVSNKVTNPWLKDTPFDPHTLDHANRLLERGLEELADATARQREMVGVRRPEETGVAAPV